MRALAVIVLAGCGRFDFTSGELAAAVPPPPLVWQVEVSGTSEHFMVFHRDGTGTWTFEPNRGDTVIT